MSKCQQQYLRVATATQKNFSHKLHFITLCRQLPGKGAFVF